MNRKLLHDGARQLGCELDELALERFERYMAELIRWNRSINLTAITTEEQIVIKHFIDSLSCVSLLGVGEQVVDIGSGAGLPGLALAIARSDLRITSVDAVDKKVRFQRHVCRHLALEQVEVLHQRVEAVAVERAGRYDLAISRAFRDVERFVALCSGLVRPGGRLVAMAAGRDEELAEAVRKSCERYAVSHQQTIAYALPRGMGQRRLVVLQKNCP